MGIPLPVFSLYELAGEAAGCRHHLLLKVEQPAFSNADQGEHDHAVEVAARKTGALLQAYAAEILAAECAGPHTAALLGELQAYPAGDAPWEECGGAYVDLWIADTRFGHPWVVMGTAESEAAFWAAVEQDEELSSLGAKRPARQERAFFLTEEGYAARKGR